MNHYQLLYFKEMYPYHKLMYVTFRGREFIFRSLGRGEYLTLIKLGEDQLGFEDAVCQTAIIYPEDYDFEISPLPGLSRKMCPLIQELSGFQSTDELFDLYEQQQQKNQAFDQECMNVIKAACPEYTYEEMETWTWDKLMMHVARAERVLYLRGIDNIKLERIEPEEEVKEPSLKDINFVYELYDKGIDPLLYFRKETKFTKQAVVDHPFLGGRHWQDDEVLHEIRRQMERRQTR